MAVRRAASDQQIDQTADPLGCEERDQNEAEAQQDQPPVDPLDRVKPKWQVGGLPAGEPGRDEADESRTDDRAIQATAPANGHPDGEIDRGDGRDFSRIDDPRLRVVERAGNPGIPVSSFTHQELRDGKIQFVHDGGTTAPSYVLRVSDGERTSAGSVVQVSYTPGADEFFSSEEEAAEAFASSQFASQSSQLPLQSNASEDEGSADTDKLEEQLLHEQALALQEISEAIEESRAEQNVDTAGLGDFAFGDEAKDARDARSSGESLKSIIKNQLTLGLTTTDPILSPIDAALDMMVSVVESSNFRNGLDSLREEIAAESLMDQVQIGSSVAVSTGLSIGYVVWLIRGGVLVSSMLSALPAWRFIDPLPILAFGGSDEDEDQESLESLVREDSPEHQLDEQEERQSPQTPEPGNS